jgi:hypothetical protein
MMIRSYDGQHGFYAGIDLHARSLHLCVLDTHGHIVKDVNSAASPDTFLAAEPLARNHPAGANGQGILTPKSCLVQPGG